MLETKLVIPNLSLFQAALRRSPATILKHLDRAINLAGMAYTAEVQSNIAAGTEMWKPPIDTGLMRSTIATDFGQLRATIYPTVDYAIYVHEGTYKMEARPFMEISARTFQEKFTKIFEDAYTAVVNEIAQESK